MADDVLVRYKALTEQYLKDVNKVIKANDQVGDSAEQGNKEAQESFKKTGKGLDNLGKSVRRIGTQLIAAFAIKQVVTSAIRTITQFEDAMAAVSAITGVTGKELDKFRDRILSISKSSGISAKEVAKAFQLIGSATPELLESAESLGLVTEQAIILSKAARLDLATASDAVTKSLNQFGLSAADAADVVNILATSQQKGTATIDQLNESLKSAGAVANAAGLSFEETNVALQALAKGGQVGAEAGTGLRTILSKLANTTDKEINPTMRRFSDVIQTLSDRNLTLQKASKLVGEEGARFLLTLVQENDVVQRLNGNLNEQGNALEQAAINTDTVAFATEQAGAAWENFVLSIDSGGGVISKSIKATLEVFSGLLQALSDFNQFGEVIQKRTLEDVEAAAISFGTSFEKFVIAAQEKGIENSVIQEKLNERLIESQNKLNEALASGVSRNSALVSTEQGRQKALEATIASLNEKEIKETETSTQAVALTKKELAAREKLAKEAIKLEEEVTKMTLKLLAEEELAEIDHGIFLDEELEKRNEDALEKFNERFDIIDEGLQKELDAEAEANKTIKQLRQENFDDFIEKNGERIANTISTLQQLSDVAFAFAQDQIDLSELNEAEREKIQERRKKRAIAQATIDSFLGASQVFISTPGELIAKSIAAAIALAAGFARVNAITSTPVTGFAEGTEFVKLGKNKKGKDTVPAMLNEGEAVIKAEHNDPVKSKAYNEGRLGHHYFINQTLPALQEQKKKFQEKRDLTFSDNIANSIGLNFTDGNIVRALQKNTKVSRQNTNELKKVLKPQRIINRG